MSGTISGSFASGVTLSVNPTTIANTTTISSAAAGVVGVYGPIGTDWVLTNQGLVSETDASSYGVSFADAGTITNTASASITGGAGGIRLVAGGSVTNGGGIGGYRGVAGTGTATTVDNAGSIEGAGYSTDVHGVGVYLGAGGLVSNQSGGTISGYYGVDARNSAATVVNAGLIAGNYTAGNADGVYLRAGGSVTNQSGGTISGDNDGVRISGASRHSGQPGDHPDRTMSYLVVATVSIWPMVVSSPTARPVAPSAGLIFSATTLASSSDRQVPAP